MDKLIAVVALTIGLAFVDKVEAQSYRDLFRPTNPTACGDFDNDGTDECLFIYNDSTVGQRTLLWDNDGLGMPIPINPIGNLPSPTVRFVWKTPNNRRPPSFLSVEPDGYILRFSSAVTGPRSTRVLAGDCVDGLCVYQVALPDGAYSWTLQATSGERGPSAETLPLKFTVGSAFSVETISDAFLDRNYN